MALEDRKVGEGISIFRTLHLPGWCGLIALTMQTVDVRHFLSKWKQAVFEDSLPVVELAGCVNKRDCLNSVI